MSWGRAGRRGVIVIAVRRRVEEELGVRVSVYGGGENSIEAVAASAYDSLSCTRRGCARLIELRRYTSGVKALTEEQVEEELSAMDTLLAIRERNRRLTLEECMEKAGLRKKFPQFTRKKNKKSP